MAQEGYKKIHVFVASPGDVNNERMKLASVINQLNQELSDHLKIFVELKEWSQVVPDLGRAQDTIFEQIPVESWDIMVGILWLRYGTPSGGTNPDESGTHEEFNIAYECWKETGKPRVLFYRCTRPPESIKEINPDHLTKINVFFENFGTGGKKQGLYYEYAQPEQFERIAHEHLIKILIDQSEKTVPTELMKTVLPRTMNTLPRRIDFFGRTAEMDRVLRALSDDERVWGIIIDGIGGIGKTALAIEAAYIAKEKNLFDAFVYISASQSNLTPEGIRSVNARATTIDEFIGETARILGRAEIVELKGEKRKQELLNALHGTKALLVFDNLETLPKKEQDTLAEWLLNLPQGCKAILTSRRRGGGQGAIWLRLEKLEWETAKEIIRNEAKRDSQVATKLRLASEDRWYELYEETKGSPLALVHVLGLMRTRAAMTFDNAIDLLRGSSAEDLQHFIFREAQEELNPSEIVILSALSFFIPSASFEALTQVGDLSRNALEVALDRLDALSLLDRLETAERFALHPLTRAFVIKEFIKDENMKREISSRFTRYWVEYANRYGGWGKDSYKNYHQLEKEWANLKAAANLMVTIEDEFEDAVGYEMAQSLVDFLGVLSTFLSYSGRWDEYVTLNQAAYAASKKFDTGRNTGWRAFDIAWINYKLGNTKEASRWLRICEEAWQRVGTKGDGATALRLKGLLAQEEKRYSDASNFLNQALELRKELGAEREVAFVLISLGSLAVVKGEYKNAQKYFNDALRIAENSNDRLMQASVKSHLGIAHIESNNFDKAKKLFEEVLDTMKEQNIPRKELSARAEYGLALYWESQNKFEEALKYARKALSVYSPLHMKELAETRELTERLEERITDKANKKEDSK